MEAAEDLWARFVEVDRHAPRKQRPAEHRRIATFGPSRQGEEGAIQLAQTETPKQILNLQTSGANPN